MTVRRIENQLLFNQVHSFDRSRVGLIAASSFLWGREKVDDYDFRGPLMLNST